MSSEVVNFLTMHSNFVGGCGYFRWTVLGGNLDHALYSITVSQTSAMKQLPFGLVKEDTACNHPLSVQRDAP